MKKIIATLLLSTIFIFNANAQQWDTATNGISYSSGNVGIGVTNPSFLLDLNEFGTSQQIQTLIAIRNLTLGDTGTGTSIDFRHRTTTDVKRVVARIAAINESSFAGSHNNDAGLALYTMEDAVSNERFRINHKGYVGIGTTDPTSLLEVESNDSPAITINNKKASSNWAIGESYGELLFSSDDGSGLGAGTRGYIKLVTHNNTGGHGTMVFGTRNSNGLNEQMRITQNSRVGIGTDSPSEKLDVNGTIRSKEVRVEATGWPDYVFEADYNLRSLEETETYIKENKHLPEIPSAKEMEANGVQLGEMNMLLLKKIEELTLHTIKQQRMLEEQGKIIEELKESIQD